MDHVIEYISLHTNIQDVLVYNSTETARAILKLFLHYKYDAKYLIETGIRYDVSKTPESTIYRSNTTGITLVLDYVKSINHKLLPLIRNIVDIVMSNKKPIEINPMFITKKSKRSKNIENLINLLNNCMDVLNNDITSLSSQYSAILKVLVEKTSERYDKCGLKLVTTVFFLRMFCPILSMPQYYLDGLSINETQQRNLIIVSKMLQAMACGSTEVPELVDYVRHKSVIMSSSIANLIFKSSKTSLSNWIKLDKSDVKKLELHVCKVLADAVQLLDCGDSFRYHFSQPVSVRNIGGDQKKREHTRNDVLINRTPRSPIPRTSPSAIDRQGTTFRLDLTSLKENATNILPSPHPSIRASINRGYCQNKSDPDRSRFSPGSSRVKGVLPGSGNRIYDKRTPPYKRNSSSLSHSAGRLAKTSATRNLNSARASYEVVDQVGVDNLTNREIFVLRILLISTDLDIKGFPCFSSDKIQTYQSKLMNCDAILWTNKYLLIWIKQNITNFSISESARNSIYDFIKVWKLDGWDFIQLDDGQLSFMGAEKSIKLVIMNLRDILKFDAICDLSNFYKYKGNLKSWSNEDVIMWLILSNMEVHVESFKNHSVTGVDLYRTSAKYLNYLGVRRIKDQIKILSLR